MTDTEKAVKINEMVETYCTSWNGHMKAAMKKRLMAIVEAKDDPESFGKYVEALGTINFLYDSFFLSAEHTDKLADFAADLHYSW